MHDRLGVNVRAAVASLIERRAEALLVSEPQLARRLGVTPPAWAAPVRPEEDSSATHPDSS